MLILLYRLTKMSPKLVLPLLCRLTRMDFLKRFVNQFHTSCIDVSSFSIKSSQTKKPNWVIAEVQKQKIDVVTKQP